MMMEIICYLGIEVIVRIVHIVHTVPALHTHHIILIHHIHLLLHTIPHQLIIPQR